MSIAGIASLGYGDWGSVADIVTLGYLEGEFEVEEPPPEFEPVHGEFTGGAIDVLHYKGGGWWDRWGRTHDEPTKMFPTSVVIQTLPAVSCTGRGLNGWSGNSSRFLPMVTQRVRGVVTPIDIEVINGYN